MKKHRFFPLGVSLLLTLLLAACSCQQSEPLDEKPVIYRHCPT